MRGMRNAYYARDNFDVRRGGRGFSCAVKNTLISQKDAVDTRTFRVKPNTPKLLSMPGKNGGQLWDLPSISMGSTLCEFDPIFRDATQQITQNPENFRTLKNCVNLDKNTLKWPKKNKISKIWTGKKIWNHNNLAE